MGPNPHRTQCKPPRGLPSAAAGFPLVFIGTRPNPQSRPELAPSTGATLPRVWGRPITPTSPGPAGLEDRLHPPPRGVGAAHARTSVTIAGAGRREAGRA